MDSQRQMPSSTSYDSSSASASARPSSAGGQDVQYQTTMKKNIENELRDATFQVDLTAGSGILHADPKIVDTVINELIGTTFAVLTSGGTPSATGPRFPASGCPSENESYKPLTHLLNKIVDTAKPRIPQSHLRGLHFHPFGGEMKDIYGSDKGLKPDGVGILDEVLTEMEEPSEEPPPETEEPDETIKLKLPWEQIEVTVESKANLKDMVRQSGTHARCCILSNQRRFFTLGIGFLYIKLEAYIFVFHRSGLSSSRPLNLKTAEGFKGLVRHIVGILSFEDEAAYCLDTTRFQNIFRINNRLYDGTRRLYVRTCLRGRGTTVYNLRGMYTCRF